MKILAKISFFAALLFSAWSLRGGFPLWLDEPLRSNPRDPKYIQPRNQNPTATPTAVCPAAWNYDDGSTQGWAVDTSNDLGFTAVSSTTARPHDGSYSLQVSAQLVNGGAKTGGVLRLQPFPHMDFTGKTLRAWIYVPAGMSDPSNPTGAFIYVKAGSGWTWNQGSWMNLPSTAGWVQLTYDVSNVANINDVGEFGIKVSLGGTSPNWTGTLYIDSFDYNPRVCATATAAPTPGGPTATSTVTPTQPGTSTPTQTPGGPSNTPTATPTATPTLGVPTSTPTPGSCGPAWNFDGGTLQGWVNSTGDTGFTNVVSNTTMPHDGSNSLAITCSLAQGASAVAGSIYYNPSSTLDLTGKTLSAWIYVPVGMSNASNPTGAYIYVKTGAGWAWSQGSWQNLPSTAGWTQLTYNVTGVANINDVKEIGVKVNLGGSSPNWSGTIYVDSVDDGICPASPTATPTPTAGSCPAAWNFDDGTVQSWQVDTMGDTGFTTVSSATAQPHDGTNSLQLTANLVNGGPAAGGVVRLQPSPHLDFTGKTLSVWVYVPAGMSNASNPSGAFIYVKTGAGWAWNQGSWQNLPSTAGWVQLTYDVSAVANINDVGEFGVKVALGGSSPNWSGTVYVDSFDYTPRTCPTATPTPATAVWNFDSGTTQSWVNSTSGDTGFTGVAANSSNPHDGPDSLSITANLVNGGAAASGVIYYNPSSTLDLTGKTLSAWIYVPAGMSNASNPTGAYFYVKTGSAWAWSQGSWLNLPSTAGWTQITYNVTGVANINDVKEIGIKVSLGGTSPNWAGNIYVDSITYQ